MEIDAASHRGIEDVRELKDKAFLLPVKLKVKVFIIDEVHMLTKEAFNALLKLIEEPPKNTLFIMCTTDSQKVPETVLSRLVRIDFRRATKEEKIKSLKRVIEGEKLKVDKKMLEMIVTKSDNSFRNLQKNFNELVMAVGGDLDEIAVEKYYAKKTGDYLMEDLEKDLAEGSLREILTRMEKMVEVGVDFKDYRERVLHYFQQKLLTSLGVVKGETTKLPLNRLNMWLNLLIAAAKQEKETDLNQLPLELAVVEFLGEEKSQKIKVESPKEEVKKEERTEVTVQVEELESMWGKLLVAVKPYNHSVEAFLRAARPNKVENGVVVLEVFYPFHKDKLEEPKNREIVEKGLMEVLGVKVGLKCVLGKSKKPTLVINNDTPMEKVTGEEKKDIYDVAKEIFG
jgi:DNA polymerase-3 subunit gamma/tau